GVEEHVVVRRLHGRHILIEATRLASRRTRFRLCVNRHAELLECLVGGLLQGGALIAAAVPKKSRLARDDPDSFSEQLGGGGGGVLAIDQERRFSEELFVMFGQPRRAVGSAVVM